jgi:4-aminobutyrate aminotransferase-like enzyme
VDSEGKPDLFDGASGIVCGYDLAAEAARLRPRRVQTPAAGLDRASCEPAPLRDGFARAGALLPGGAARVREAALRDLIVTSFDAGTVVVDLGYPTAGMYVAAERGVYLDAALGAGRKLLCDHHPALGAAAQVLAAHGAALRRDVLPTDFVRVAPGLEGQLLTATDLAVRLNRMASGAFPAAGEMQTALARGPGDAVEVAMKLCLRARWESLCDELTPDGVAGLMRELGIPRDTLLEARDPTAEGVWRDHPLLVLGFEGAYLGPRLGLLAASRSQGSRHAGYPRPRWVEHFAASAAHAELAARIDRRPLAELVARPGELSRALDAGRIPAELVAGFIVSPLIGDGGWRPVPSDALRSLAALCADHGVPVLLDETASFLRTGRAFMAQDDIHEPDVIAVCIDNAVGAAIARAPLARKLTPGWHAGGPSVPEVHLACAALDAVLGWRDPTLDRIPYLENQRVKGARLEALLSRLRERYPGAILAAGGAGTIHGLTVRQRDRFVREAWRQGLRLLPAGPAGDTGRVRVHLLADALAREVEHLALLLDRTFKALERTAGE